MNAIDINELDIVIIPKETNKDFLEEVDLIQLTENRFGQV